MPFAHSIAGGQGNLIAGSFQSPNYVEGVSGWQVTITGDAEFNNVKVRGEFYGDDFFLNDSGAFFYTGVPALDNLLASIAAQAGSDQYGNTYGQGFNLYGPDGAYAQLVNNGTAPALLFAPPSVAHMTSNPQVFALADNAGLVNEFMFLILSSGKSSGGNDAGIQLWGETADGSSPAQIVFEFGGTVAATMTVNGFKPNAWTQTASYGSGWEASGEGADGFWFRLRLDAGTVEWMCDLKTTSGSPSSTICTIPAAYVPATGLASFGMNTGTAAYSVSMQSSGAAQASVSASSGSRFTGSGFYPLTAP
jgi:hypothetical protein